MSDFITCCWSEKYPIPVIWVIWVKLLTFWMKHHFLSQSPAQRRQDPTTMSGTDCQRTATAAGKHKSLSVCTLAKCKAEASGLREKKKHQTPASPEAFWADYRGSITGTTVTVGRIQIWLPLMEKPRPRLHKDCSRTCNPPCWECYQCNINATKLNIKMSFSEKLFESVHLVVDGWKMMAETL